MLLAFHHFRHAERRQRALRIEQLLDLEPDAGQRLTDLFHACFRVEMLLQPCERELHGLGQTSGEGGNGERREAVMLEPAQIAGEERAQVGHAVFQHGDAVYP